jgi:peptidoglycan/LPS O-acetylase OafA/YrhL
MKPAANNLGNLAAGRIPALDGLRGLAILLVLLWHSVFNFHFQHHPILQRVLSLGSIGWSGVDLFFVLSGFLIGGILLDAQESPRYYRTFYVRRAHRILPLYFAVLVPCWLLLKSINVGWVSPAWSGLFDGPVATWTFATFTQNIGMAFAGIFSGGGFAVTWSLAIEEQFYLTLPPIIRNVSRRRLWYLVAGLIVASALLRVILIRFTPNGAFSSYVLMPCRADALGMGVLCALLVREERGRSFLNRHRRNLYVMAATMFAGILCVAGNSYELLLNPFFGLEYSVLGLFYALLLLIAVSQEDVFVKAVFCNRLMTGLGTIAYGTYLFHRLTIIALKIVVMRAGWRPTAAVEIGTPLLGIAVAIMLAAASWHFFEKPMVKRGHEYRY